MAMRAGAQATSGSIVGHVTDASGALIPGADVTAINVDTHISFHGVTDKTGTYDLLHVTPGNYEIKVSHAGFGTQTTPNATVTIDQQLLQNFTLNVGEVQTVTTVTTAPTLLQTQTAETGTVIGTAGHSGPSVAGAPLFRPHGARAWSCSSRGQHELVELLRQW